MNLIKFFFFDAHCHNHRAKKSWKETLSKFFENCYNEKIHFQLLLNGVKPDDWCHVTELYRAYSDNISPSYGIHPWYAMEAVEAFPQWESLLCDYLNKNPYASVGEIGVDLSPRALTRTPLKCQRKVYETQLKIALQFNRLVSIHCVRAHELLIEIFSTMGFDMTSPPIILHSFSGNSVSVKKLLRFNCYFSFSSSLSLNSKKIKKTLQSIPLSRLLVESDAPDQLPSPSLFKTFLDQEDKDPYYFLLSCFKKLMTPQDTDAMIARANALPEQNLIFPLVENQSTCILVVIYGICVYLNIQDPYDFISTLHTTYCNLWKK